jgi:hypothetical protein
MALPVLAMLPCSETVQGKPDGPRWRYLQQPSPVSTRCSTIGSVTAIARTWANGDQHLCKLCPTCVAGEQGVCLVVTTDEIEKCEMSLYRAHAALAGGRAVQGKTLATD